MADMTTLRNLCLNEKGNPKPTEECRAVIINHLILEELTDIDEAENIADKTIRELGFRQPPTTTPMP